MAPWNSCRVDPIVRSPQWMATSAGSFDDGMESRPCVSEMTRNLVLTVGWGCSAILKSREVEDYPLACDT